MKYHALSLLRTIALTLAAAFFIDVASAQTKATDAVKMKIGMNLAGINDYSLGYPFKNLMWGARPWLTKLESGDGPFNTEMASKMEVDENGYPLEVPFTPEGESPQIVFTIIPNCTEPGEYVVLYDGEGEIEGAMTTKVVESAPGRVVIELKGAADDSAYEGITIKSSVRGNHIRNIRILALKDENADLAANPFREDFLEYCKQWHALRFMDWAATNDSLEKEWSGRKKPTFYTMVGSAGDAIGKWGAPPDEFTQLFSGGVAIEIMIQLANMTKVDPWFCVPHRATPEYMTEFAKLVKAKLDPSLKVYLEYSNEVWNWQFQQAHWMLQCRVAAEPLAGEQFSGWKDGIVPTEFPLDGGEVAADGGADHPERMAVLFRRCFKHWEDVYTGEDRKKLVRVIGVQSGWYDTAQRTVKWVMANGGADAMAGTGYFGPDDAIYERWEAAGAGLTVEQVISDMSEVIETTVARDTPKFGELADSHNLEFLLYEAGQHIQPKNQEETDYLPALRDVQFSKGLYDLYMRNMEILKDAGVDLYMAFSSVGKQGTRWGSWGHQEFYGQSRDDIPKFGALLDANIPRAR